MENHGNTCYFNTALQCMFHVPQLSNHLLEHGYQGDCEFTQEYSELVRTMWTSDKVTVNPKKLLTIFQTKFSEFNNQQQHDSHEVILKVLEILEKSIPGTKGLFGGKLVQETVCPTGTSLREEDFTVLNMIPDPNGDMSETFKRFFQWNTLTDYVDNSGVMHHCSTTRTRLQRVPPIFILCFPYYTGKVRMNFPENFILDGVTFTVFATCTHMGSTHGGHYVAFVKHQDQWYIKNDALVQKIERFPNNEFHYLIFLKQIDNGTPKAECPH